MRHAASLLLRHNTEAAVQNNLLVLERVQEHGRSYGGRAGMSSPPSAQLAWCLQQPVLKLCLLALPMHFAENIPTQHTQSSSSQTLQEARQRANPHTVHRKRHARCLTTVQQRRTTTAGRKETCGPCPQPTNSSWGSATTGNGALVSKEFCTLGAAWHTLH